MIIKTIKDFFYGQINTLEDRSLPPGAASDELNWITKGDKIELRRGYGILGNEIAGTGKITSIYIAKRSDGTEIPFRTRGKKLEYYISATETWTEIGSDVLGTDADGQDIWFAEYHTLAGDQLFVNSPKGPLLKIMLANPGSYADMYASAKNYKGRILIKTHRMFLWGRDKDKTGLYLSYIDSQTYTTVSAENIGTGDGTIKTFDKTLAFKAGGAKRTCFGITATDTVEKFKDNYNGTLTGDKGGTGTINYMTGAISVTFNTAPANAQAITADYQWEDSTNKGICDFTYSATRLAGEGDVFRQDDGGGELQTVMSYGDQEYCIHEKKTWVVTLTNDDTGATNLIFREKVGISSPRSAVATGDGIYLIDNSGEKDPQIKILTLAAYSDKVIPKSISKGLLYKKKNVGIDLSGYNFDGAIGLEWGDYILFACKISGEPENNRMIVYDKQQKTIDITDYWSSGMAIYGGTLISGDPFVPNVYTLFSGFDDDDSEITNHWAGNKDDLDWIGLKKVKQLIIKGEIAKEQKVKVSVSTDNGGFVEVGEKDEEGEALSSGPLSPGTMADDDTVGTVAWGSPDNAKVSDNVYATAVVADTEITHYLKATNFGFSIPIGATINGIVVEVEKKDTYGNSVVSADNAVRIVKSGTIGSTDKSSLDHWSATEAYKTYGSSSELWGETWSPADINDDTFGFAISAKGINASYSGSLKVDHIRITVYYTTAITHIYAIEGSGSYVDIGGGGVSVGRVTIGSKEIGGGGAGVVAYNYEKIIKLKLDKFGVIKLKFEATALGYYSVSEIQYKDIRIKSRKLPKKYRS